MSDALHLRRTVGCVPYPSLVTRDESCGRPTAISLFSGAGGLDIAAHQAGFSTLAAVESVARYAQTLSDNATLATLRSEDFDDWFRAQVPSMGRLSSKELELLKGRLRPAVGQQNAMANCKVLTADIKDVSTGALLNDIELGVGEVDLVIGGPPCQSFSKSGQRRSISDLRGQLFLQFSRFIEDLRPRWFLFENVKGMTHSTATVVRAVCPKCGPFMPRHSEVLLDPCASAVVCSTCGMNGEVTSRKDDRKGALEVIVNEFELLGYICHVGVLNAAEYGVPQYRERVFIVGSRDNEYFEMPSPTHGELGIPEPQGALWDWEERRPFATVWETLFRSANPYHTPNIDPAKAVLWVKNVVRPHAEPVTWDLRRPSPTVGSHQAAKLAIAPDGVPEEQIFRQQWHTRGRRQGDTPPVKVDHSYLSDSDLLKLQSFPETWHVAGTRMERAFQIGNAVPPGLGTAVLQQLGAKRSCSAAVA